MSTEKNSYDRDPTARRGSSRTAGTSSSAQGPAPAGWNLALSYGELPAYFYERVAPTPVARPELLFFNEPLAAELGLDPTLLARPEAAPIWTGNQLPPGCEPLAQAYAGHQFGNFTTLGDGRAILLGEQITPDGMRYDLQWKGSGPTPYSRRGDGRAALGPMLREVIISEAMHALGIPTTRGLAVAGTGETVWRERGLPGAVLTRVAQSHLRVGTFEWASARGGPQGVEALLRYSLQRHYPALLNHPKPALAFFEAVMERQAGLLAQWMLVGFVHGVMNTDNMAVSGETIDYGPCAFLETYDPETVFSSIDHHGRYAYGNQPRIAQWNLARLAEALLPLFHPEEKEAVALANASIQKFEELHRAAWLRGIRAKLGLFVACEGEENLIAGLLEWMREYEADFTNTFVALGQTVNPVDVPCPRSDHPAALVSFTRWTRQWKEVLDQQSASPAAALDLRRRHNPAVIPRNHLVEAALTAAENSDFAPFHRLLAVLRRPFHADSTTSEWKQPAPAGSPPYRTFCGT